MAELGDTDDPKELIPGDYAALQSAATDLSSYGDVLGKAGAGLKTIDTTQGWRGQAADAFRGVFHGQPIKWTEAGDAFRAASEAVDGYSTTLLWAQGQASDAIRQWNQAQAATRQAQEKHAKQPPGAPFNDPGEAGRTAAEATLERARQQLDGAGNTAAGKVERATQQAPPEPSFWSKVGSSIEDAAETVGQALENAGAELVNDAASFGNAALNHPGQFAVAIGGAALTAVSGAGEVGGGLLDATGFGALVGVPLNAVSAAGIATGIGITGAATGAMAMEAAGEDHVEVFDSRTTANSGEPGEDPPFEPPNEIKGYRTHARERMFDNTRGDGGVNDEAAKDAVENPIRAPKFKADSEGGKYVYTGKDATVSLNKDGEVVTAWPRNSAGRRFS